MERCKTLPPGVEQGMGKSLCIPDKEPEAVGNVLDIKRFSIHDGPGIRTTVFLKGCPLHCMWCHNPESIGFKKEIGYLPDKCIHCGECTAVCAKDCHYIHGGKHIYNRNNCDNCGQCVRICPTGALKLFGEHMPVSSVMMEVMKDKKYYENSGGGLSISGGEPMAQFDFTMALLKAAKREGLHTCIETCGYAQWQKFSEIKDYVDLFLYDYKESDVERHIKYTGVDNKLCTENLLLLDGAGAKTIMRCPVIPGLNDREDHFKGIAQTANKLKNVERIEIMPFHPFAGYKYDQLGVKYSLDKTEAANDVQVESWISAIRMYTSVVIKRG